MKKIILFLSFSFYFSSTYGGNTKSERSEHKVKFGIEAGLNFPKMILLYSRFPQVQSAPNNHGIYLFALAWHAGIYSTIHISDKFYCLPELEYSVKGYRYNYGKANGGPDSYGDFRYNYFEIPIQLKYKLGQHFSLIGGLYFGILTTYTSNVSQGQFYGNTKILNKLDFGGKIGIGYSIPNGFNFALKYSQGFRSVSDLSHNTATSGAIPELNLVFSLCVGWTIEKLHK